MAYRDFTEEERLVLLSNRFTRSASGHFLKFTDEFNDLFMMRHEQGIKPSQIFKDCGYDINIIGHKRVEDYYARLKSTKAYKDKKYQEFLLRDMAQTEYSSMPPLKAIEAMQTEITYLRQEIDFLKKIISLANKKKRKD